MSDVLLFSIGIGGYNQTQYRIGNNLYQTRFSSLALYQAKEPDAVLVLATKRAYEKTFPTLCQSASEVGLSLSDSNVVLIPDGRTEDEIQQILNTIIDSVNPRDKVYLDITNSFRHLPFTYFSAIGFLTSLKQVDVEVYYAAFEQGEPEAPVLNLTSLIQLNDWYHALRDLQEAGDIHRLAERICSEARHERQTARELRHFASQLARLDESLSSGLPLEVGLNAEAALSALEKVPVEQLRSFLKVGAEALRPLAEELRSFAIRPSVSDKARIELSLPELERELRMIRWYLAHGQVDNALRLMREWVVNRVMLSHQEVDWLDLRTRNRYEWAINALCKRRREGMVSGRPTSDSSPAPGLSASPIDSSTLGSLWTRLADARNAIAHAGFTKNMVEGISKAAEKALKQIMNYWQDDGFWRLTRPLKYGRMLLNPLGTSPGQLYTAILRAEPEVLFVLTSERALPGLREALQAAGRLDLLPVELGGSEPNHAFILADPYAGYLEASRIGKDPRWSNVAPYSERIVCNVTGGTTVLQWCASALADAAYRLGVPVQKIAVVDRRSHDEQQRDPFVLGEMVTLTEPQTIVGVDEYEECKEMVSDEDRKANKSPGEEDEARKQA